MEGLAQTALDVLKRSPIVARRAFIVYPGRIAMTYILAIDQSTSATKAVLFDAAGRVVDRAAREHRQIYPQAGWVEHDAEEIWQNVLAVLRELASRNAEPSCCGGCAGDHESARNGRRVRQRTGRPLHNAIVWQCRRGEPICQELRDAGHERRFAPKPASSSTPISRLEAQMADPRAKPEIRRQLESGDALIGTIDTYLIYRLTKAEVFATDHTNASRTLLYDIGRLRWDEELCCLFDVPMRALAEVRESFAQFGATDADGALPKKLCICGVMGDSQASLFAQGCYEPGSGQGDVRLRHVGPAEHGRSIRAVRPRGRVGAGLGVARATDLRARRHHQLFLGDDRVAEGSAWVDWRRGGNRGACPGGRRTTAACISCRHLPG